MCTPSACSSSSARPVRRLTETTSGMSFSSRSATAPSRSDSDSAMPGLKASDTTNDPSLNGGRKAFGNRQTPIAPSSTAAAATTRTNRPRGSAASSSRE